MTQDEHSESRGRILAIEPDVESAAALERTLRSYVRAELLVVQCVDDALDSLSTRTPDLILTSTFLSPADEMRLSEHLRRTSEASHTQVITLPQFVETAEDPGPQTKAAGPAGTLVRQLLRKSQALAPRCDAKLLAGQIDEYLEQAAALRVGAEDRRKRGVASPLDPVAPHTWALPGSTALVVAPRAESRMSTSDFRLPADRRRARRRKAEELLGSWAIKLPAGEDANIVDISPLGVMLETASPLTPDSIVHLRMLGGAADLAVAARLIRTEVAVGNGVRGRYRVAAAFTREVDLFALQEPAPMAAAHPPKVLGDVLGRVLAGADWVKNGPALRVKLQEEIGRLVHVHEVRIRAVPDRTPAGCESMCFSIPTAGRSGFVLQAVFPRGHDPSPVEVRLLKAAAALASVVLELAPMPSGST